jgi:glycosyltransferase involved in cell wall biosynthesis
MRVMLVSDTYPPQVNGVANCVRNLALALHADGHAVLVCTALPKRRIRGCQAEPFPVIRIPAMPLPRYADFSLAPPVGSEFARMVHRFQPDIVHCHTPFSVGWQGLRAARAERIPVLGTHHTLFGEYVDSYLRLGHQVNGRLATLIRRYVAHFYNQCDLTSSASRYLAGDLAAGGMRRPTRILRNPVDTNLFRPLQPTEMPARAPGETRIVYFGRLAAEKNLLRLITLVEPALWRNPGAVFDIVGDGPMMTPLAALIQARGLAARVHLRGWMRGEALARHVAACDIGVSASQTENQPLALLESLACGLPIVALASAGVPEIIDHGHTGFLVDPAAPSGAFADRLDALIAGPALRRQMGANACAAAQHYSPDACLHANLTAYRETQLLARAHHPRWRGPSGLRARRLARIPYPRPAL